MCLENDSDVVVLRLDGEAPILMLGNHDSDHVAQSQLDGLFVQAVSAISQRSVGNPKNKALKVSERDSKILLKQAFTNYLILLLSDIPHFGKEIDENYHLSGSGPRGQINFDFASYAEAHNCEPFFKSLSETQMFRELLFKVANSREDPVVQYIIQSWNLLSETQSFADLMSS